MMIPVAKAPLLEGKQGPRSSASPTINRSPGAAPRHFARSGAELAITYLNDKAKKFVEPLARELEAPIFMPLDVRTARPDGGGVRAHPQGMGRT